MNRSVTQDLARKTKISLLKWRIERVHSQLHKCQSCTPESRALMLKLVTLVQRRNDLHTPDDVRQIERERGLA